MAWNFVYGASETYPQYGFYDPYQRDQTNRNTFTQAYIVSTPDTRNAVGQWQQSNIIFTSGSEMYASIDAFENWTIPWLLNRIILGSTARWKAIYNGFDRVWSVLQALQRLVSPFTPPIVPSTMTVQQDGWPDTIATGNWSARELCKIVRVRGNLLAGNGYVTEDNQFVINNWVPEGPVPVGWPSMTVHSVGGLLEFLYNVANGNWAGPPGQEPYREPPRPLSFRGLLAGAAA